MPFATFRALRHLSLALALSGALGLAAASDAEPGLVGEYFSGAADYPPAKGAPFYVRVDKQVNFPSVEGEFSKTRLSANFSARWTGLLRVEKAGAYQLATDSDDGSRLFIDGKEVVDNGGLHGMQVKPATIELTAGDHALKLEYFQGEGGAGCRLLWTPPGGNQVPIPASALFHAAGSEKIAWNEEAWKKAKPGTSGGGGKYAFMDYGPIYSHTVVQPGGGCANKAVVVTLARSGAGDEEKKVLACFDTELLTLRSGGPDASINYATGRDGLEGQPSLDCEPTFTVSSGVGWARPGGNDFKDPRAKGQGNLPKDWGTYRGLYLHGSTVVFSYTVGAASVLEVPGHERGAITRSFTLAGNAAPLTLLAADGDGEVTVADGIGLIADGDQVTAVGAAAGGTIAADGKRLTMTIPAGTAVAKLALWRGPKADLAAFKSLLGGLAKPVDAKALTKGGALRWAETLTTAGELGSGDGAYVADTLTVPYDNPWKCYMRTTGIDFFADGRIAVCTIDGDVWTVSGVDATLSKLTWKRFAAGMFQPLGLRIVDDQVYITCRDRLVRLHDLNKDGEADFYESFNSDCEVTKMYHEFALGLETDKEGNFYYNKGSNLGDSSSAHQGCVLKISKDGSTLSIHATGMRAPNGMGGGDGWPLTNSDNQGNWTPACRVNLVKPGGFYGFMGGAHRDPKPTTYDPPICWLPMSEDNSSGGQVWVSSDKWGPLKDRLLHMSYGKSSLFVMPMEEIDGVPQGGIVRFPLTFVSGMMRARFAKQDGQLYITGMRGWQTNAGKEGGLYRVRYTGGKVYLPISLKVVADGVAIGFDQPLDKELAGDAGNYAIERWNYKYTSNYGSDDFKVSAPDQKGRDKVEALAATLSADGKTVTLKLPDHAPVMQQRIKMKIAAADGTAMSWDLFHTINKVPAK